MKVCEKGRQRVSLCAPQENMKETSSHYKALVGQLYILKSRLPHLLDAAAKAGEGLMQVEEEREGGEGVCRRQASRQLRL